MNATAIDFGVAASRAVSAGYADQPVIVVDPGVGIYRSPTTPADDQWTVRLISTLDGVHVAVYGALQAGIGPTLLAHFVVDYDTADLAGTTDRLRAVVYRALGTVHDHQTRSRRQHVCRTAKGVGS